MENVSTKIFNFLPNLFYCSLFCCSFLDRNVAIMGSIEEKIVWFSEAFMRKYFPLRLAE